MKVLRMQLFTSSLCLQGDLCSIGKLWRPHFLAAFVESRCLDLLILKTNDTRLRPSASAPLFVEYWHLHWPSKRLDLAFCSDILYLSTRNCALSSFPEITQLIVVMAGHYHIHLRQPDMAEAVKFSTLDTSPPTVTARKIPFRMSYMLPPMTDITIALIKQIRSCYIVISSMHAIFLFLRVLIAMTCLPVSPPTCCFFCLSRQNILA